ncbi:hypothetical protein ACH4SK_13435 [Streptomyces inhibens]|uniref:hypothetical protein n=1 Tax=Streptomyces inhibens TaxID=2293571 RepID=UPI0037B0FB55
MPANDSAVATAPAFPAPDTPGATSVVASRAFAGQAMAMATGPSHATLTQPVVRYLVRIDSAGYWG